LNLADGFHDPVTQPNAPGLDPDDAGIGKILAVFQDLVSQTLDGNGQLFTTKNCFQVQFFPLN
jgi:hypothetical protein